MIATLIQFAFNLPLSAAFTATGAYRTTKLPSLVKRKYAIKLLWTLLTALSFTSFYTIYNNTQRPHARAFFAACSLEWWVTSLSEWTDNRVFAWINFNTMGIILAFVPPPFVIMALLPVIVTSGEPQLVSPLIVSRGGTASHRAQQHLLPHLVYLSQSR